MVDGIMSVFVRNVVEVVIVIILFRVLVVEIMCILLLRLGEFLNEILMCKVKFIESFIVIVIMIDFRMLSFYFNRVRVVMVMNIMKVMFIMVNILIKMLRVVRKVMIIMMISEIFKVMGVFLLRFF